MKIIILCDAQPNQVALANKTAKQFQLAGIVIERPAQNKKWKVTFSQFIEKALNKTVFISLSKTWFNMLGHYEKIYPDFPEVEAIHVPNINTSETVNFINRIKPDLIMVSGTSLLRKKILELPIPLGIINLHTGLSPYVKGAPNCTNWCIAENKMHLIGNTVMWIDAGIDSGDLVTTAFTPLNGDEAFLELHIKVMEHAHELYLSAVKKIRDDINNCPRIKQSSIATGTTYYNRQWNWKKKLSLLRNVKKIRVYFHSDKYLQDKATISTVPL